MKKILKILFLAAVMLAVACAASAEETVTIGGKDFDASLEVLDLDEAGVVVKNDIAEVEAAVLKMPALKEVRMYKSTLTHEQMDHLFDTYPDVFFGWTLKIWPHVIRTDQTAFSTLHGNCPKENDGFHNSYNLSMLRYCKYMQGVDIGHNYLTDLSFLAEMPQIKVLIIASNYRIVDISPLAALKDLEYLEIFATKVTDISPLASCTKLRDLNMACVPGVTDLTPLDNLPLERFMAAKVNVTKEQKAAFEAAHPDCRIDWTTMPSLGMWRQPGSHYDTIYKMFHEMKYYPFED